MNTIRAIAKKQFAGLAESRRAIANFASNFVKTADRRNVRRAEKKALRESLFQGVHKDFGTQPEYLKQITKAVEPAYEPQFMRNLEAEAARRMRTVTVTTKRGMFERRSTRIISVPAM